MPRELIPIIFIMVAGLVGLTYSPIGLALARRLGGARADSKELENLRGEVAELRAEVDDCRAHLAQLDEMHERLDFAERALAQVKAREALPGGR